MIPSYSHFELVYWITFTYCFTASSSLLHFEPHHLCAILRYPSRLLLSAPYWRCEAPHLAPFQRFHRFQRETGTPPGYSRANPQRWRGHHSAQPHPHPSANQTSKLSRLRIQGDYKAKRSLAIRFNFKGWPCNKCTLRLINCQSKINFTRRKVVHSCSKFFVVSLH